ncbi:UPF0158 family protein [Croceivirga sp. JEA036]|uniref:UPF0158 family protein n=1 Tax=Croceivirga sp. JEA036 TaxID=2721162 RepID=UPI00143C770F|nr:UPF0158 family protein [Croceivirga sp. JEA036]NJB37229.1 hypothetical protein [Croceivirga sp. JEA036]
MKLSEENLKKISELLDTGMDCFYHPQTGQIEYHPDVNHPYFEPEHWTDVIQRIDSEKENYIRFEKMDTNQSFKVMEDFAKSLEDSLFKSKLLLALTKPKPFRNYRNLIDASDFRNQWFDYKNKIYIEFVRQQAELLK